MQRMTAGAKVEWTYNELTWNWQRTFWVGGVECDAELRAEPDGKDSYKVLLCVHAYDEIDAPPRLLMRRMLNYHTPDDVDLADWLPYATQNLVDWLLS